MSGESARDLTDVRRGLEQWFAHQMGFPPGTPCGMDIELTRLIGGGYSNEIIFVTLHAEDAGADDERLVLRLPPTGPALFPSYDLAMQVAVQSLVGAHGVPVPFPVTLEPDEHWLGVPFLLMPRVEGLSTGEAAAAAEWVDSAPPDRQRALETGFLDAVARIHLTPWQGRPAATRLRGPATTLADEVGWWSDLTTWVFDGAPPDALMDAFAWCRHHLPTDTPPASVLWGDVRLGNVIFHDDYTPAAVLDWEMASIGPAELDLAWYTALETMTGHFFGRRVPGFLSRDEVVAQHARALGRPLVAFDWFEVFALCRSTALNLRADRLTAHRLGKPPRPVEAHPVLRYTCDAIAALS